MTLRPVVPDRQSLGTYDGKKDCVKVSSEFAQGRRARSAAFIGDVVNSIVVMPTQPADTSSSKKVNILHFHGVSNTRQKRIT